MNASAVPPIERVIRRHAVARHGPLGRLRIVTNPLHLELIQLIRVRRSGKTWYRGVGKRKLFPTWPTAFAALRPLTVELMILSERPEKPARPRGRRQVDV